MLAPRKNFSYKIAKNVFISKYLTKKVCTTAALKILSIGTLDALERNVILTTTASFFRIILTANTQRARRLQGGG